VAATSELGATTRQRQYTERSNLFLCFLLLKLLGVVLATNGNGLLGNAVVNVMQVGLAQQQQIEMSRGVSLGCTCGEITVYHWQILVVIDTTIVANELVLCHSLLDL
jgi:hypothetical protein